MALIVSGIEGLGEGGAFVPFAVQALGSSRFELVDVGCAGGLSAGWRTFGDRLAALGVDGDAAEIERLTAAEANPAVRFQAGMVGLPDNHPLRLKIGSKTHWHHHPAGRDSWERTYDLRRARAEGRKPQDLRAYFEQTVLGQDWLTTPVGGFDLDYVAAFATPDAPPAQGSFIHLPDAVAAAGLTSLDFLKIDVDGPDYQILRSVGGLLEQPSLLGVAIEVSFFGSHDANDNSFHNVDRLMRQKGFELFSLSQRTYASAALPWPYLDNNPGKTAGGRVGQGDAIYLRDFGSRVRAPEAAAVDDAKLLKTAILLSLMEMHDWAAEVLIVHRARLSRLLDVDAALDLLSRDIQADQDQPLGFADYVARFEAEDPRFFNAAWPQAPEPPPAPADTGPDNRVADLEQRLQAIERSASWRLTAPLRSLSRALRRIAGGR